MGCSEMKLEIFTKVFIEKFPERCLGLFPGIFIAGPRNDWGLVQKKITSSLVKT